MRNKHNSSAQEQEKVRVFRAIQHGPVTNKYTISYKTKSEIYAKAYNSVRMEDK